MIRRQGDWLMAQAGGVKVIMSREKVRHIGVTDVGARIWDIITTPMDIDAVCTQLRKEYAIDPDACRAEVDSFLNELASHGAVSLSD